MTFPPFTADEIDRLEQLNQERTQGPWRVAERDRFRVHGIPWGVCYTHTSGANECGAQDAEFIAELANQASRLLAISRQHAETVKALAWYADNWNYTYTATDRGAEVPVLEDGGRRAVAALAAARPPDTQKEGT